MHNLEVVPVLFPCCLRVVLARGYGIDGTFFSKRRARSRLGIRCQQPWMLIQVRPRHPLEGRSPGIWDAFEPMLQDASHVTYPKRSEGEQSHGQQLHQLPRWLLPKAGALLHQTSAV